MKVNGPLPGVSYWLLLGERACALPMTSQAWLAAHLPDTKRPAEIEPIPLPNVFSRSIEPIDEKRPQCKRIKRCEEPQMAAGGPVDMVISSRQRNAYLGRDHALLALETFT